MKVGIDISQIVYKGGVSYYTKNLVTHLVAAGEMDFVLFGSSFRQRSIFTEFRKSLESTNHAFFKIYPLPISLLSFLWNRVHKFPIENLIGRVEVFHSSDWIQPPSRAFLVTTIHDLSPFRFPQITPSVIVETHKRRLFWVKKEVNRIIAVSSFTKKELVELLQIDPAKIVVIPEAVEDDLKPSSVSDIRATKRKFGIQGNYLLVVGASPRKNLPAVLQAFAQVKKHISVKLVIVGRPDESLKISKDVIVIPEVSRKELINLYSGASLLIYVSLYEGFGLPILEAMKLACPVVTSNVASMPEVAGDAAVLVDPTSPDQIAKGIETVLAKPAYWIKKGLRRVNDFSWQHTAQLTMRVYREALRQ